MRHEIKYHREKCLLLGALALLAPIPLPFNEVVKWPPVIAFMLVAALFLSRAQAGSDWVLPYWAMNLLAVAYVPFLLSDLTALRVGKVLQPLVHLALFAMAVKLFGLRREKDKWHLFLGLFFLFVASMGTSVHPSVLLYLAAFGTLAALTLVRFAGLHSVSALMARSTREPRVPVRRFLTATLALSVTAAIPLFFFLPRLRQPYVYVPTGGAGGAVQVSGFSDRLDLGMIDRVRSLRTVVFRFAYETPPPPRTEMRFKAATYDRFVDGGWRRERSQRYTIRPARDGFYHIHPFRPVSWMKIWLGRGSDRVPLPVEATTLDLGRNGLVLDETGEARLLVPKAGTVEFRAGMTAEPVVVLRPMGDPTRESELDASAVTPRMAELARSVMASGELEERIRSLESFLRSEYSYSLDPVNGGPSPIESFLFDTRQGHCEYFASAMVLLLRSQGIAARLATGYLGADYNPLEEYMIVRQANAHAWVEAFLPDPATTSAPSAEDSSEDPGGRWQVFDPTPADARPQTGSPGWKTLISQGYDYLLFRWDRHVLTYGFGDQVDVFVKIRDVWLRFWRAMQSEPDRGETRDDTPEEEAEPAPASPEEEVPIDRPFSVWRAIPLLAVLLLVAIWFWRRREPFSATKAYRGLRAMSGRAPGERTAHGGLKRRTESQVPPWVGPLKVEDTLNRHYPQVARETRLIVSHYVRESFAEEKLSAEQLAEVRAALAGIKEKLKRTA